MRKQYRLAQESIYAAALAKVGVKVKKVTSHRDASATIPANEKVVEKVRKIEGVEILSAGAGSITFRIPAAIAYHTSNPPLYTEDQRAAMESEKEARRKERAEKVRQQLLEDEIEVEDDQEDVDDGYSDNSL